MSRSTSSSLRRLLLAGVGAAGLTAAIAGVALAPAAMAATTTLYASPSGTGTSCSAAQPCSLSAAQAAVRSLNSTMSDDIVVQLADGVYRLSAPLRFTAADSGTNGRTVVWQAAPSARPVISGARAVTGWSVADAGQKHLAGQRRHRRRRPAAVRQRRHRHAGPHPGEPVRLHRRPAPGLRFTNSALSYLNNLANQNRIQMESVNSFTDRYVSVQSISGNLITMQQPGWSNNTFGYDTFASPHRAGPLYLTNAYEFLDSPGEWYLNTGTGTLYYIPLAGQNMSSVSVELPVLQSLVQRGRHLRRARAPHLVLRHHLHRHQLAGRQQQPGLRRPADRRLHQPATGSGPASAPATRAVSSSRPPGRNWSQMPAAVQVSAANTITFTDDQFVNLGQTAIGIGNDANAHASGVGLGASNITVTGSEIARNSAGGIVVGGVRADAHHPSDQRMVNRDITISNNRIHDLGIEYRGIVSVLTTYVTNATMSHNEVYNLPYTGMSIGYGWGANDAGGSNHYADRGLYNYQPRYSTATTASNNRLIGNYVHDVMQQMTDGGCIYTLSANPSAMISDNYCLRTNGWFGLYFDEGSRYYTATNNVFSATGTWATANYWFAENMGNFTVTNNWTHQRQHQRDQRRPRQRRVRQRDGHQRQLAVRRPGRDGLRRGRKRRIRPAAVVSSWAASRAAVSTCRTRPPTNGTQVQLWDCSGAANQRWTYTAAKQLPGLRQQVPGRLRPRHHQRHPGHHLGLQRPDQPAVERQRQRHHHRRPVRTVRGRQRRRHRQRHEDHPLVLQRPDQPAMDSALAARRGADRTDRSGRPGATSPRAV